MGPEEAVKETFHQLIKMAILFGGMAIFYIWLEAKILRNWKSKKKATKK